MCGLFGFSGKKGRVVNLDKLIILGLFNESRGTDSCGYYYNGNIVKGINKESKFSAFIADNRLIPGDLDCDTFIGHTRKGTSGAFTAENAHPHVVGNYVQTHNGRIDRPWQLCEKYDISHTGMFVDSIGLAHIIRKVGPKVLNDYAGYAALAFTYMDSPEALYLYHGESREKKDGPILSERPMYILHQPEGLYYSSMFESLKAINNEAGVEPLQLTHNLVCEVVNGEFTSRTYKIYREDANVPIWSAPVSTGRPTQIYPIKTVVPQEEENKNDLILTERYPELNAEVIGKVFYFQGRYFQLERISPSGTFITPLLNGKYIINRDAEVIAKNWTGPLEPREERYYFIEGIMIKSENLYDESVSQCLRGLTEDSFKILSHRSVNPIIQLKNVLGVGQNLWIKNGLKVKKDTITPKFTKNSYQIKYGVTKNIFYAA